MKLDNGFFADHYGVCPQQSGLHSLQKGNRANIHEVDRESLLTKQQYDQNFR